MDTHIIRIDTSKARTDLCDMGAKYNTDKSPYAENSPCYKHRKGYTAVYNLLLSRFRGFESKVCELGIFRGNGLQAISEYFNKSEIHGVDNVEDNLTHCQSLDIPRTSYHLCDVTNRLSLEKTLSEIGMLDVVIDDSTHQINDQVELIEVVYDYLNPGGVLIIEDLRMDATIPCNSKFTYSCYIDCEHANTHDWDNHRIWYGIK